MGMLRRNFLSASSAVRRQRLVDLGGYDEALQSAEDYSLWMRLIFAGSRAGLLLEPLNVCDRLYQGQPFEQGSVVRSRTHRGAHQGHRTAGFVRTRTHARQRRLEAYRWEVNRAAGPRRNQGCPARGQPQHTPSMPATDGERGPGAAHSAQGRSGIIGAAMGTRQTLRSLGIRAVVPRGSTMICPRLVDDEPAEPVVHKGHAAGVQMWGRGRPCHARCQLVDTAWSQSDSR